MAAKQKPEKEYFYGLGRRKTASARVRIFSGGGAVWLNKKLVANPSFVITQPLNLLGLTDKFNVSAKVTGGGSQSQLEAIRLGVSRALIKLNADYKKTLRLEGMLTRDPRAKERKKPGLKRARKAPQWQKR